MKPGSRGFPTIPVLNKVAFSQKTKKKIKKKSKESFIFMTSTQRSDWDHGLGNLCRNPSCLQIATFSRSGCLFHCHSYLGLITSLLDYSNVVYIRLPWRPLRSCSWSNMQWISNYGHTLVLPYNNSTSWSFLVTSGLVGIIQAAGYHL